MILILNILDFENMSYAKFQIDWSISLRDIHFLISFNVQVTKC